MAQKGYIIGLTIHPLQWKRKYISKVNQKQLKHTKTVVHQERSNNKQIKNLTSILQHLEDKFIEKKQLLNR